MQKSCTALCRCRPFRTSGPRRRSRVTSRRSPSSARRCEFPSAVDSLGPRGKYLTIEVWWSPAHPFKSSLTGQSARQLCDAYEEVTKKQWTQALGFRHALFEVAIDVFKRAQNPESAASVIEAVRTTKLNTIVGPVQWQGPPPNQWTTHSRQECLHHAAGGRAVGAGKEVDVRLGRNGQPEISSDPRAAQDGAAAGIKKRAQAGIIFAGRCSKAASFPYGELAACFRVRYSQRRCGHFPPGHKNADTTNVVGPTNQEMCTGTERVWSFELRRAGSQFLCRPN